MAADLSGFVDPPGDLDAKGLAHHFAIQQAVDAALATPIDRGVSQWCQTKEMMELTQPIPESVIDSNFRK